MKIRGKLLTGYILVALLTVVVGWFSLRIVNSVNQEFKRQAEEELPFNQSLQDLKYAGLRVVSSTIEYAFLNQQRKSASLEEELERELTWIAKGIRAYNESMERNAVLNSRHRHRHADGADVEALRDSGNRLIATSAAMVTAIKGGVAAGELLELKEANEAAEKKFLETVEQQYQKHASYFAASRTATNQNIQGALRTIFLVTGSTLALAILSGMIFSASFARRLSALQEAVRKVGEGDLKTPFEVRSTDEIGSLARSFQRMAHALNRSTSEIIAGKEFFSDVIHSMMDALIVVSPDGAIQQVNAAACAMLGYEDEPMGRPFLEVLPDCTMEDLVSLGYLNDEEKTFVARDGRRIPVRVSVSIIWNRDNSMRNLVCVAHDITSRKRWEAMQIRYNHELQDSNDELRAFVYTISHDLRTPLVNIRGFAGELSGMLHKLSALVDETAPDLPGETRSQIQCIVTRDVPEAINFIDGSVRRMDTMLSSILQLSHMGQRKAIREPVDTGKVVSGILARMGKTLQEAGADVVVGDLPELLTDGAALEEILLSLLDNAIKYRAAGRPPKIGITAEKTDAAWLFRISDNGRGISDEDLPKIFDPFRRAGQQETEGEGMGLAYVRALVKHCRGRIWCSSRLGEGSTFNFTMGEKLIMEGPGGIA